MNVAQRGTSGSGKTSSGYYATDRWGITIDSMGTWTVSQETDAPDGTGLTNSTKYLCTTADASPASGDASICYTRFEGQDLQYLEKGTSAAKSVTVSFWVKSNTTGTYILELYDNDNARHINKSYTINSSATWEKKQITFEGDTNSGDTFGNDSNLSLIVNWWLGAGSAYQSGTLATSWQEYATADRVVGQVNVAGANNNYFQITGVQLEVGSVATEFEHRSFAEELTLCQRYFEYVSPCGVHAHPVWAYTTGGASTRLYFAVEKRTRTYSAGTEGTFGGSATNHRLYYNGAYRTFTGFGIAGDTSKAFNSARLDFTGITGVPGGSAAGYYNVGSDVLTSHVYVDDEL